MRRTATNAMIVFSFVPVMLLAGLLENFDTFASIEDGSVSVQTITTITTNGGRVDWSAAGKPIVFDRQVSSNHYEVFTMNPDGSDETCVTCGNPTIPHVSNGNPAWDPNGHWIVFQAVKQGHLRPTFVTPGIGTHDDLWLIKPNGRDALKLVSPPDGPDEGVLHPHFSPDGTKLTWSQMTKAAGVGIHQKYGYWELAVADFSGDEQPSIAQVTYFQPGGDALYENHGMSPDNQWLYFTSNMNAIPLGKSKFQDNDIYRMKIATGAIERLTVRGYNEHAELNATGDTLVYMSSVDEPIADTTYPDSGTDYWLMDADGRHKRRLTYFNVPGHAEYSSTPLVAADSSWSPDGTQIVSYLQTDHHSQAGKIVLIRLGRARWPVW